MEVGRMNDGEMNEWVDRLNAENKCIYIHTGTYMKMHQYSMHAKMEVENSDRNKCLGYYFQTIFLIFY